MRAGVLPLPVARRSVPAEAKEAASQSQDGDGFNLRGRGGLAVVVDEIGLVAVDRIPMVDHFILAQHLGRDVVCGEQRMSYGAVDVGL